MAQFVLVPPLAKVEEFFVGCTSKPFVDDICWCTWASPLPPMEWLRPYIRPCHQKILNETISGTHPTPLALLRQILRPYNYKIETTSSGWTLLPLKQKNKTVGKKPGTIVIWPEPTEPTETETPVSGPWTSW